jgi:7-cyano-7-deazaguanine tRNA-ribosyltransferase
VVDFYVSWSHSDALFTDYYPNCSVLISALPDNRLALKRFNNKPQKLMIDCGSVFYVKKNERPTLKEVFDIQLTLVEDCPSSSKVTLVHFDEPMLNKQNLSERYAAMERTLFNAYEYLKVYDRLSLPKNFSCMGVIQGFDRSSIRYAAHELKKLGYVKFGIGSLLGKGYTQQLQLINYATEVVGASNLHVFGVTGIPQMLSMVNMGIASFDSTRPTMAAAYYQVFYSQPFRTYFLATSRAKLSSKNRLSEPLPCECPVCEVSAKEILKPSPREYMKLRSLHNYYHLVKTFNEMIEQKERA